jgi:glycosyltransferase involved in cell wall biosynthesis
MEPVVVILTFNSEASIRETLTRAAQVTNQIFVIDSGSTDSTLEIAMSEGVTCLHHAFISYGEQRNWAISAVAERSHAWQLHLDADEALTDGLIDEIRGLPVQPAFDGYLIPRYVKFLGRVLKHNLAPTYHMRLFAPGMGACEKRKYDQHFVCFGSVGKLLNSVIDDNRMPLTEWTRRHNLWADAEVQELLAETSGAEVRIKAFGNAIERRRFLRSVYEKFPLFSRPFFLFVHRYILGRGFLDGKEGLIFCVLQTFWFRFLIDAKLYELQRRRY